MIDGCVASYVCESECLCVHVCLPSCMCELFCVAGLSIYSGSLDPRLPFLRGKRAWYTLSAHASKFPEILGIWILP